MLSFNLSKYYDDSANTLKSFMQNYVGGHSSTLHKLVFSFIFVSNFRELHYHEVSHVHLHLSDPI